MSFKKSQKSRQKPHRERAQIEEREYLGFLEKKKDYVARAKDFKGKQARLKSLKRKALERNPDEFYWKMTKTKLTEDGVHELDNPQEEVLTAEQQNLMETQNIGYVRWKLQIEQKKVLRLQSRLKELEAIAAPKQHIYFVDSKSELKKKEKKKVPSIGNVVDDLDDGDDPSSGGEKKMGNIDKIRDELEQRLARYRELKIITDKLETNRAVSRDKNCDRRKLVAGETKTSAAQYKWRRIRNK